VRTPGEGKMTETKLLYKVKERIRFLHYSIRTEKAYISWIKQFIKYFNYTYPSEMGAGEIEEFLNYLANKRKVAASTQNQALNALNFLYNQVLDKPFGELEEVTWAKRPKRMPR
jgi:site-specific recombinase XerD